MTRSTFATLVLLLGALPLPLPLPQGRPRATDPDQSAAVARGIPWRFVGPWRGGWATVAAGVPDQRDVFYFGGAGGGVWKTTDAGRTWRGLMQHERSSAIGALAIAPSEPAVIYVGTGQV